MAAGLCVCGVRFIAANLAGVELWRGCCGPFHFYSGGFPLHSNGTARPISCSESCSVCVCVCLVVCKFQLPSEPSANCSPYKHIQQHVRALTTRKQSFYSARCVYKLFALFSDVCAGCCSLFYSPACGAARLLDTSLPTSAKLEPLIAIPFCGSESVCFLFPSCLALNVFKGPAFKLLRFLSFSFTAFHKLQFCNP